MLKKCLIGVGLLALVAACSSRSTVQPLSYKYVVRIFPEIGSISTQELGSTLLNYSQVHERDSWKPLLEITTAKNVAGVFYVLQPKVLRPSHLNSEGQKVFTAEGAYIYGGNTPNGPSASPPDLIMNEGELCLAEYVWGRPKGCFDLSLFQPATYENPAMPRLSQERIYNGRSGDALKFVYREITGTGLLRSPFTQNITYDLSLGTEIGFKGARFEVIDASNRQITYKVLEGFQQ